MKRLCKTKFVGGVLALFLCGRAAAGPIEEGEAAYWRGDYVAAMKLLRPLADHGNAQAQFHLGRMYAFGQGVPEDPKQAVAWYRRAARQGNADAEYILSVMVQDGSGAPPDAVEALAWLHRAADQGVFNAQYRLAKIYAKGEMGLPRDYVLARMWFSLAAPRAENAFVHDLVTKDRDRLSAKMTVEQIAAAQRLAAEWTPKPARETVH